ncbi:hypothetical protein DM860_018038 [Cuscuta australis]|uniref:Retrotransposon Copia-like N-terminal domain-containing protein n=1 Tax=Cuscuta australis TaxID=267555 RepID=A0A328DVL3_9ASTE|nr:hypothetical protein DM860_018038 [Cuscuta australis]
MSEYDLSARDNPHLLITQNILKDEKYEEWEYTIRITLCAAKKFGFVDNIIPLQPLRS